MRVVIDCANGGGYRVAPEGLWELGAEVFSLGVETGRLQHQQGMRLDLARGAGPQGARDARRHRHRARRRRRPRRDSSTKKAMWSTATSCSPWWPRAGWKTAGWQSRPWLRPSCPISAWNGISRASGSRWRARRSATAMCSNTCARAASISAASPPATSSCPTMPRPVTASSPPCRCSRVVKKHGKPVSEVCHRFDPLPQVMKNVRYREGKPLEDAKVKDRHRGRGAAH